MKEVEGERKIIIMRKEFVICLIIIALIAIGNFFSRDYTKKSGEEILDSLQQIKQAVEAKEDDVKVKEKLEYIGLDLDKVPKSLKEYFSKDYIDKSDFPILSNLFSKL